MSIIRKDRLLVTGLCGCAALSVAACSGVGPVNLTERKEIDQSQVATFRVCNLGAAIDAIDEKKLLYLSKHLTTNVAYVEPGNHKVDVSGQFGAYRAHATVTVPAKAGKVYTFHYRNEGDKTYAYYRERPSEYSTSCDIQVNSKDD